MRFLSSGSDEGYNQGLEPRDPIRYADVSPQPYSRTQTEPEEVSPAFNFRRILHRYWLLLLLLMIVGAAGGFASVVLTSPRYKTHLLMQVQNSGGTLAKIDPNTSETSEVGIQTQVTLMKNPSYLAKAAELVQSDSVPLAPTGRDIFSRIRQRIHPTTQDPLEAYKLGIQTALNSFDARPVNKTLLIELTCESSSPDVAAQFLNAMAREVVSRNTSSRMGTSNKTQDWLAGQIDEQRTKVQKSEQALQDFVQASGNVFAGQDATLDDTKLARLKGELSAIQAERIKKQTMYEQTKNAAPETLPEVLDDGVLRGYKTQLDELKREKAKLETIYTPKNAKVQQLDAQIGVLDKAYESELNNTLRRVKNDYEAALKEERLLNGAYAGQAQRVGSEASKAAQYGSLQRDVATQRQIYQNLLAQQSEASMNASVPVVPISTVEETTPPQLPFKPQPVLNISFGTLLGLVLTAGIVFIRERSDSSIKEPGIARRMFNAPELGVIPNLSVNGHAHPRRLGSASAKSGLEGDSEETGLTVTNGQRSQPFITESFRSTLASILRNQPSGHAYKTILVTSPGPSEGKTTVVQNLGIVLAETGRKVLLIDADFRRPHLHRKFGLPNEWGLIDLLSEDRPFNENSTDQLEVPTGIPGLSIIPNRVTQNNVAKVLYSPRFRTMLRALMGRYDMVLVDAPPILSIADARIVAPLMDGLILVLRCGVTDREAAMAAYQRIQEDGLSLLGTVLTDYDTSSDRKRHYYYDYGYGDASRA